VPRVLLADHSTRAQRIGVEILTSEGCEVITVNNGVAAKKKLAEGGYDLVLADINMPGHSGYELAASIKADPKMRHLPVILVFGQMEPYDDEQGKNVGADGVLSKPFEASKMLAMVKQLLAQAAERKKREAPPPPPPPPEPEPAAAVEEAAAAASEAAAHPAPMEVPPDMAQAAFDVFVEQAPPLETVAEPAPSVEAAAAASVGAPFEAAPVEEEAMPFALPEPEAGEPAPEPETVLLPPAAEAEVAEPVFELIPEEAAVAAPAAAEPREGGVEMEVSGPAAAAAPAPALHWVAEPEAVTDADRALFAPPAVEQAAPAAEPPAVEAAPDWGALLSSIEEPAPPQPEAVAAEAAPETAAAVAPETIAAIPPEAPPPPAIDEPSLRAAVESGLEKGGMPGLKAVPGLVDAIVAEVLRRLGD
jgi:CheY-like chemotaxis protein